ncbi:Alpha/Beta hydrolase protein [Cristinia sonorae]|uniref:Carboxylic ester hydrolase n=1 Tax=Cristinia sonorae TaxID=1940300 RepID=A0A8K0UE64_9AGAR|nr:Alpha/Beta hydrolase protein [Cristinia sonorae]
MVLLALVQAAVVAFNVVTFVVAAPAPTDPDALLSRASAPTVSLDQGTFTGASDGFVNRFLGIPFAKPPVGDLRFRLPVASDPYTGPHSAANFGAACPQQDFKLPLTPGLAAEAVDFIVNTFYGLITPDAEDCLSINVWTPTGVKAGANLPVAVWMFGGGFEIGGTNIYNGGAIVKRSIDLKEPVVYVSMNYRVSAFGFLGSKEVKAAGVGNLGLQDQRLALRWVQKYITAFGGDPTKVTIWGESAGAISVALHMVTNGGNTEGLFRGAFMQSGSPIPIGDISHGQKFYDALVSQVGCSGASDTLQCLRQAPYKKLKDAVDASPGIFSPQSLALAWAPRVDGVFLKDTPQNLVLQGSVANVPFVTGDCDDEGTLFALSSLNVTTESQLRNYLSQNFVTGISQSDLDKLLQLYPGDITKGSPFDTSILNALTPQFKRIAAILGDLVFQGPRRFFLQQRSGQQNTWSFLSKRLKLLPGLGSGHATDLLNVYGGGDLADYVINFVNRLDPNGPGGNLNWPKYDTASAKLLTLQDGFNPQVITQDNFRKDAIDFAVKLGLDNPL